MLPDEPACVKKNLSEVYIIRVSRNNFRIHVLFLPVSLLELLELPADDGGEGAPHHRPGNPVLRQARREQVDVARVVVDAAKVALRGPTEFDF